MANARPPIALHAEIETADGFAQYRWDANDRDPENRPQSISCSSTLMNGYANGGAVLARRIARNYPDLGLYDTIRFVGADGQVAYEGRGSRYPREANTQHRITAEAVGWISHARDTRITFLGLDQDMASWGQMTAARQAAWQIAGYAPKGPGTVMADKTLSQSFDGDWIAGELPICEAWFDAGPGDTVGAIYYSAQPGLNVSEGDANWQWEIGAVEDTLGTAPVGPGDLQGAPANSGIYIVTDDGKRYVVAHFFRDIAGGTAGVQYNLDWTALQVIGYHGLPLIGTGPYALLGSDIIKRTAALAAPLLDTSGVLPTSHPIDQFVVRDPTDVYDIWLLANAFERWNLAVWDSRRLVYEPLPDIAQLQTADWVLRSDHANNLRRGYDGPSTDGAKNGVQISFQNILTGEATLINPTTHPELADTNTQLAANRAGIRAWEPIQLTSPTTPASAAKIGAAALKEFNHQRTPGRFTITGHIRDGADNWHQGWIMRAGQTVVLEEDDDDPIRLVYETSWNQDSRELTISADAASKTIDAIVADIAAA